MEELHFDFECEPDEVRLLVPKQLLLTDPDLQLQVSKLEQLQLTAEEHDEQLPVHDSDQNLHSAQNQLSVHESDQHNSVLAVKDQHGAVPLPEGHSIVVPEQTQHKLDAEQFQRESAAGTKLILVNAPDLDQLRITVDEDIPTAAAALARGDLTEHSYALGTCHALKSCQWKILLAVTFKDRKF